MLHQRVLRFSSILHVFFFTYLGPHTLFGIANQLVEIQNLDFGRNPFISVPKAGDLLYKCHFEFYMPALTGTTPVAWTHYPGLALLETIEIDIGSQDFDTHTGEWMYIWSELTIPHDKRMAYLRMIGQRPELVDLNVSIPAATLIVPLQFWFCRRPSLALQLASLDFAEVRFKIKIRALNQMVINYAGLQNPTTYHLDGNLYVDYVHLDVPEHNSLIDNNIELVYENLQTYQYSSTGPSSRQILQFSHPTKFIAWYNQKQSNFAANRLFDFTDSGTNVSKYWIGDNPLNTAVFNMYASSIDQPRSAMYYNQYVPFEKFTRGPVDGINVFSWALVPEDPQPTGTLNFSKVDQANIVQTFTDTTETYTTNFYVWCYNTIEM
jgi:hypothetical protein